MATFEERFYVTGGGFGRRLWRDVRLVAFLARMGLTWLVAGGRIRRAYRQARANGETFWLDALDPAQQPGQER